MKNPRLHTTAAENQEPSAKLNNHKPIKNIKEPKATSDNYLDSPPHDYHFGSYVGCY